MALVAPPSGTRDAIRGMIGCSVRVGISGVIRARFLGLDQGEQPGALLKQREGGSRLQAKKTTSTAGERTLPSPQP